jgi:hypothetical protein
MSDLFTGMHLCAEVELGTTLEHRAVHLNRTKASRRPHLSGQRCVRAVRNGSKTYADDIESVRRSKSWEDMSDIVERYNSALTRVLSYSQQVCVQGHPTI